MQYLIALLILLSGCTTSPYANVRINCNGEVYEHSTITGHTATALDFTDAKGYKHTCIGNINIDEAPKDARPKTNI